MATLLAGWGATIRIAWPSNTPHPTQPDCLEVPVADFVRPSPTTREGASAAQPASELATEAPASAASANGERHACCWGPGAVLTHIILREPAEGDYFWCHKVRHLQLLQLLHFCWLVLQFVESPVPSQEGLAGAFLGLQPVGGNLQTFWQVAAPCRLAYFPCSLPCTFCCPWEPDSFRSYI